MFLAAALAVGLVSCGGAAGPQTVTGVVVDASMNNIMVRTDAGDTVDIKDCQVYVNGEPLDEPYIREPMAPEEPLHFEVPEDSYFMMGDNRNWSSDSRYWNEHFVTRDKLIAKVLFRYFPLNSIAWLDD